MYYVNTTNKNYRGSFRLS